MSEFHVEVVRIGTIHKHPNADSLSITTIHDAYPVIFKTGTYNEGDLAAYIPVDSIVPNTAEWAWLNPGAILREKDRRIRAKKLRGVFSMGMLTKAPEGVAPGTDVAVELGITKYDPDAGNERPTPPAQRPKARRNKGIVGYLRWLFWTAYLYFFYRVPITDIPPPKVKYLPGMYDIEPFRKYGRTWFEDGETFVVTEKIHGQNASFIHDGKKLHVKSRTRWRRNAPDETGNTWAAVAKKYDLENKLAAHPGMLLFGETYGNNTDMPYGVDRAAEGDRFCAFDVYDTNEGRWLDYMDFAAFCASIDVPTAPRLHTATWSADAYDSLIKMAEGKTTLGNDNHVREGFVIKPFKERRINGGQRVILKMAGEGYLTRKAA